MLETRNISVALSGKQVLHGVDFHARPGELTVIAGPNGSGKTTLLRALTGDIDHGGSVRLNGQDVRKMAPWELAALRGVLPQASSLAFPFTVREIVRLGAEAGLHSARRDLPEQALAAVDLASFAGRMYQELSGGEQQRVQLARVLAQVWQPVTEGAARWIFLDEPVASLDIGHQLVIMRLVSDFVRRGGGAVAVMHDLNLSAMFADRIALMADGRLLALGAPHTVLTDENLLAAYGCPLRVNHRPENAALFVLPHSAAAEAPPVS